MKTIDLLFDESQLTIEDIAERSRLTPAAPARHCLAGVLNARSGAARAGACPRNLALIVHQGHTRTLLS